MLGVSHLDATLKSVRSRSIRTTVVTTTAPVSLTLSVEPAAFTLPAGGSQVITITANVGVAGLNAWLFLVLKVRQTFVAAAPVQPGVFPVGVHTRAGSAPAGVSELTIDTRRNQGQTTLTGVRAINSLALAVKALYLGAVAGHLRLCRRRPDQWRPLRHPQRRRLHDARRPSPTRRRRGRCRGG